jgi:hypothetical protein
LTNARVNWPGHGIGNAAQPILPAAILAHAQSARAPGLPSAPRRSIDIQRSRIGAMSPELKIGSDRALGYITISFRDCVRYIRHM